MKKIYEAFGEEKRAIIEDENDIRAYNRQYYEENEIGLSDMALVGRTNSFPFNSKVDIKWSLNGLIKDEGDLGDIIIIEPLSEQINNPNLLNINEVGMYFESKISLSKKAIILMPLKKYNELCEDRKNKRAFNKMNIRLYEGDEALAIRMLFIDKRIIYLDVSKDGYILDYKNHPDTIPYMEILREKQKEIVEELRKNGRDVTYGIMSQSLTKKSKEDDVVEIEVEEIDEDEINNDNSKMITGLTKKVEGNIQLDDELYASTDIGKARENQEDAVLLIKDEDISEFKMMAVADGMGGWQYGEVASHIIINKLKEWFEGLSKEEKEYYYEDVNRLKEILQEKIERDLQVDVEYETEYMGGSTLVCAVIGKNNTLVTNIGDSRACIIKNGKLNQISREDTVAQINLEKGKTPNKEAARFDMRSNEITQCLGMNRRDLNHPHSVILNNMDYDMLLLFSDGVTDCLSDDDIAVVCNNSNRKEVIKRIVEKAIRHDSIRPEEYEDFQELDYYISGGKDNTTAAAYIPKDDKDER